MYHDLLVPTDGSDGTRRAVVHGLTIAERFDATVHALSIVPEGPYGDLGGDSDAASAERAVERVAAEAHSHDVDVVTTVTRGVPDEEILAYAAENEIDVIVMGTRARTGLDRVLVGSVTERVVREASVPVLTVRLAADGEIEDPETAERIAREVLGDAGYESVDVTGAPSRRRGWWIVAAAADDEAVEVRVDAASGDAAIAPAGG